jgi:CheY-like chemotaxis protein
VKRSVRMTMRLKSARPLMARVLLADDNPTSRLTLQTILQAGGYSVDTAASAAEAVAKLDEGEYELVLSDAGMESPESGYRVLSHARMREYKPATALLTAQQSSELSEAAMRRGLPLIVETEAVPELLTQVADLISLRASRKLTRELRMAAGTAATH